MQSATRKWNRNRKSTDSRADKDNTGCYRVPCSTLAYPSLQYLWQPSNSAQTILRLFVCFAHLNCCSFNIHSHAEGSQPTVCPPLSATAVRLALVSIFKYFPLTDFTIFHFHTFFSFGCRPWPKTQAPFFYLLFIHSATASLLMLPSSPSCATRSIAHCWRHFPISAQWQLMCKTLIRFVKCAPANCRLDFPRKMLSNCCHKTSVVFLFACMESNYKFRWGKEVR